MSSERVTLCSISCHPSVISVFVFLEKYLSRSVFLNWWVMYSTCTVQINHILVLHVLAGKKSHEGMIYILFRSRFQVSLTIHVSIVYAPWLPLFP